MIELHWAILIPLAMTWSFTVLLAYLKGREDGGRWAVRLYQRLMDCVQGQVKDEDG